jgi:hypothetical protein
MLLTALIKLRPGSCNRSRSGSCYAIDYYLCIEKRMLAKADLSDVTFIIPFRMDSAARLTNLKTVLEWISSRFETSIIVSELDQQSRFNADIVRPDLRPSFRHCFCPDSGRFFSQTRACSPPASA